MALYKDWNYPDPKMILFFSSLKILVLGFLGNACALGYQGKLVWQDAINQKTAKKKKEKADLNLLLYVSKNIS